MYNATAKGYFSGAGLMELGLMQAGVNVIQSSDLDPVATACMKLNSHYFSYTILTDCIKSKLVSEQPESDIIVGMYLCNKYSTIADYFNTPNFHLPFYN
jgi:DNA (cytosine-5)-methyltransferase 1